MKFVYEQRTKIIIEANSKQSADEKLVQQDYTIDKSSTTFKRVLDDKGNPMEYIRTKQGQQVWYQSACPCNYSCCILDPARKAAENCNDFILTDKIEPCTYNDNKDDCDEFDNEDK